MTDAEDWSLAVRRAQKAMQLWIIHTLAAEEEWLRIQLEALKPGESLCVHGRAAAMDSTIEGPISHTWWTTAHMLPLDMECGSPVPDRLVYGPMPACPQSPCSLRIAHPGDCPL